MTKECLPCKIQTESRGQRSKFQSKSRGAKPRGIWIGMDLCPRDEVWILQGKHSFVIGYTFQ